MKTASLNTALFAIAAAILGFAMQINDGLFSPWALLLLCAALLTLGVAVFAKLGTMRTRHLEWLLIGIVAAQILAMFFHRAGASEATVPVVDHRFFQAGLILAAGALVMIGFAARKIVITGFIVLLFIFAALGAWKIKTAPYPRMDVCVFHKESAHALARGENPYAITFPDVYGADNYVYLPGAVKDGRVQTGYAYPPIPLVLTAGAELALGDFRFAQLAAMLTACIFLAALRPDRIGVLMAAAFLFTPRAFYVLEMGWTEPISVALLTAVALAMARGKQHEAIPMGLLIASKQYLPITLIFWRGAHTDPRKNIRVWLLVTLAALAVTLPFFLWNPQAFWNSVFAAQLRQPFRPDALSFLAGLHAFTPDWTRASWIGFAALTIAAFFSIRRKLQFFAAIAFCLFVFFAFGRQAFANYYYLILGAIACQCCAPETPRD